jgi:hypothetical protein
LQYRAVDAAQAADVARQFEDYYARWCRDLQCDDRELAAAYKLIVRLWPETATPAIDLVEGRMVYTLTSPRISGLYYQDQRGAQPSFERPVNRSVMENVLYYVARASIEAWSTWPTDVASEQWLLIIADWERLRVSGLAQNNLLYQPELLASQTPIDLAALWTWSPTYTQSMNALMYTESVALIRFIDETYGAEKVVQLLHTLGQAGSLPGLLEAIGLPDTDFNPKWQAWLKRLATTTD